MFSKLLFATFLFLPLLSQASPSWNLNDVSYLLPLPTLGHEADFKILPTENSLLPKVRYQALPGPAGHYLHSELGYDALQVVAVRIDPIQNQIRMVWQMPHLNDNKTGYETDDYALHSFYQLKPEEMKSVLVALFNLKLAGAAQASPVITDQKPLGLHPAFKNLAFRKNFFSQFKKIVLSSCDSKHLIQVTSAQATTPHIWWDFMGFRKEQMAWSKMEIPRVSRMPELGQSIETQQAFSSDDITMDESGIFSVGLKAHVVQVNHHEDNLEDVIGSGDGPADWSRADFQKGWRVLRKFQNPQLTTSILNQAGTLDCVSCHITEGTAFWLNRIAPGLESESNTQVVTFKNPNPSLYDLSNQTVSKKSSKILRAFGYWASYPVVNQRVINESAQSAESLNQGTRDAIQRAATMIIERGL